MKKDYLLRRFERSWTKKEMSFVCTLCKSYRKCNLISSAASSISAPGNAAPQVVEALRKAGVKGLPDTPERVSTSEVDSVDREDTSCVTEDKLDAPATSILKSPKVQESGSSSSLSGDSPNEGAAPKAPNRRKSVTFAEGTKLADAPHSKSKAVNNRHPLKTINEIKRRAGLLDSPGRSIKLSSASKDKMDEVLGVERAGITGHATSGQLIQGKGIDTGHDRTQNHNEDTSITSSKSAISAATTRGWPSETTSHEEDVLSEHPPNNEAVNRDADSDSPIIPADESPEDAALRRQMLGYSMNEVGSVVAEIELDEDDSDASYTDDEYGPNSDASSAEEDEDDFGRTKRRVLDDAYLEEMRALEKKLNATPVQNIGPQGSVVVPSTSENSIGKTTSDDSLKDVSNLHTVRPLSKGVRFIGELDVQSAPPKAQENDIPKPVPGPVRDTIIERVTPAGPFTEPKPEPKKRTSRFMSARKEEHNSFQPNTEIAKPIADCIVERTAPETSTPGQSTSALNQFPNLAISATENGTCVKPRSPLNRTHNPIVIERPYSTKADPSTACEPDELDPALLHQQVATEYHSMRNRMIQRQGGFLATDEEKAEVALTEEEGGAPKISRFKAARLARLG